MGTIRKQFLHFQKKLCTQHSIATASAYFYMANVINVLFNVIKVGIWSLQIGQLEEIFRSEEYTEVIKLQGQSTLLGISHKWGCILSIEKPFGA